MSPVIERVFGKAQSYESGFYEGSGPDQVLTSNLDKKNNRKFVAIFFWYSLTLVLMGVGGGGGVKSSHTIFIAWTGPQLKEVNFVSFI